MPIAYTAIFNDYDTLKEPYYSEGWDYVCFSDKPQRSLVWRTMLIDRHNRDLKINCPFNDLCLWVDGSIEIIGDLNEFITEVPLWFSIWKHPHRNCTYDEAEAVIKLKGMDPMQTNRMMLRYLDAGFPRNFGLGANGIMLRSTHDPAVQEICDMWWREFTTSPPRDQLSLMYCFWKSGYKPDLFENDIMNKYFKWLRHK